MMKATMEKLIAQISKAALSLLQLVPDLLRCGSLATALPLLAHFFRMKLSMNDMVGESQYSNVLKNITRGNNWRKAQELLHFIENSEDSAARVFLAANRAPAKRKTFSEKKVVNVRTASYVGNTRVWQQVSHLRNLQEK